MHFRRLVLAGACIGAFGLLGGCAALNTVTSDVSSFGEWPSGRSPGTYGFERLPSQQAQADQQASLEAAARNALAQAGFKPAAEGAKPDVTVQLGARINRYDRSPWDDPLWWRWGAGYWRYPGWRGGFGYSPRFYDTPSYEREVALLIRDGSSGKPLYEARATSDGVSAGGDETLSAMYAAALKDFPTPAVSPRRVSVPLAATQ